MTTQFGSPTRALLALLDAKHPLLTPLDDAGRAARAGGRLPSAVTDFYIRVALAPGGRADQLQGTLVFDVECFATTYAAAESAAYATEALLLGYPHVVEVEDRKVIFDSVYQNVGPSERPWADDSVYRVGATYTITTRRK